MVSLLFVSLRLPLLLIVAPAALLVHVLVALGTAGEYLNDWIEDFVNSAAIVLKPSAWDDARDMYHELLTLRSQVKFYEEEDKRREREANTKVCHGHSPLA